MKPYSLLRPCFFSLTAATCFFSFYSAHGQPVITNQPAKRMALVGEEVKLSVGASGASLSFQWHKDGVELLDGSGAVYSISNAQTNHSGVYSVTVSDASSSVTSSNALVRVETGRHVLLTGYSLMRAALQTHLAALGHTSEIIHFGLFPETDFSRFSAIWISTGNASALDLTTRSNDLVNFVAQGGVLFCQFGPETLRGYPFSGDAPAVFATGNTVRILDPAHPVNTGLTSSGLTGWGHFGYFPAIDGFTGLADRGEPGFVTIARPVGYGNLVYSGLDVSRAIQLGPGATGPTSPKGILINNILRLTAVAPEDPEPVIISHPPDLTVTVNTTATLGVNAAGATPLHYQWHFNEMEIPGATKNPLVITNARFSDAGNYSVVVTNGHGIVTSSNALLKVRPAFPMTMDWQLLPGDRPYLTTNDTQRGIAYNGLNDHLLVADRIGTAGNIYVLDAANGDELHQLNTSVFSNAPGYFKVNKISVAADGAVYGVNLVLAGSAVHRTIVVHRWADDSQTTASEIAFAGTDALHESLGRVGDTLDVRGSGLETEILLGTQDRNKVLLLKTTDGTTFQPVVITVTNVTGGFAHLGLAFGEGNTFWTKSFGNAFHYVEYDAATEMGRALAVYSYSSAQIQEQTLTSISVDVRNNLLAGVHVYTSPQDLRLYDVSPLEKQSLIFLGRQTYVPNNHNPFSVGATTFGGGRVYGLNSGNGIIAAQVAGLEFPPVIRRHAEGVTIKAGSDWTFAVSALGYPAPDYQWFRDGEPLADETNAAIQIVSAAEMHQGNYSLRITNVHGEAFSSNAFLNVQHRPVADASLTRNKIISPNGIDAIAVFDGSRSFDMDGDVLRYEWKAAGGTELVATGMVAVVSLPVGTNEICLFVDDGWSESSSDCRTVIVLSLNQALEELLSLVQAVSVVNNRPFIAKVTIALGTIEDRQVVAFNNLNAFQNQVKAELLLIDPVQAQLLLNLSSQIMGAINKTEVSVEADYLMLSATSKDRGAIIKFTGTPSKIYIMERSTNLLRWEVIGVAREVEAGNFRFEHDTAHTSPVRYYRCLAVP